MNKDVNKRCSCLVKQQLHLWHGLILRLIHQAETQPRHQCLGPHVTVTIQSKFSENILAYQSPFYAAICPSSFMQQFVTFKEKNLRMYKNVVNRIEHVTVISENLDSVAEKNGQSLNFEPHLLYCKFLLSKPEWHIMVPEKSGLHWYKLNTSVVGRGKWGSGQANEDLLAAS